jgi:hypothetical protein
MTLAEALAELELAATERGGDIRMEDELLDLATLAIALTFPELWQEPEAEGEHHE